MSSILNYCWQFSPLKKIRPTDICSFPVFWQHSESPCFFHWLTSEISFTMHCMSFRASRCHLAVSTSILASVLSTPPPFSRPISLLKKNRVNIFEKFYFLFGIHKHYISPQQNFFNSVEHVLSTFFL